MQQLIDKLQGRLLAPTPELLASVDHEVVAAALRQTLDVAHQAHPTVKVTDASFLDFLVPRLDPCESIDGLLAQFESLELAELYLVCGCLQGDDEAGRLFVETLRPTLERVLSGLDRPASELGELEGTLFAHLFVSQSGRPPKIEHYRGEGALRSWVKVVAVRLLLNRLRDEGRLVGEDQLLEQALDSDPTDVRYMKALYRDEFKRAFQQALASLSARDRTLLRFQLLDGLGAAEIAQVYRVHRATVHRWQQDIQQALLERTRACLRDKLAVGPAEVDSIVRLIQSNWQVSLTSALRAGASTPQK